MPAPALPIGLYLTQVSRAVSRAFEDALNQAGGSTPVWLVLLNVKIRPLAHQRELSEAVGVREATLTSHLNAMHDKGLITRQRDESNRRLQRVELTDAGEAAFLRLRDAAVDFDTRLRQGLGETDLEQLRGILNQLAVNVGTGEHSRLPWPGPAPAPPEPA